MSGEYGFSRTRHSRALSAHHDVLIAGAGPAGRALAAACAERGLRTCVLDPAPHRPWRATYGAWCDELPAELPDEVIAARARGRAIACTAHVLNRDYAVLDPLALREHLDHRMTTAGVCLQRGRARPGYVPPARVVIDAGGAGQPLSQRRTSGAPAEQTAFGLMVPAELAEPVLAEGEALFMDWRPAPGPSEYPTFLYAVPLGHGQVLLEETSLARRPGLAIDVLVRRLRARLAAHRITPPDGVKHEVVRFRLDVPRHQTPGVLGFGAAAPLTHPATGYQLAATLRLAPMVAEALIDHWADGPNAALAAATAALWSPGARMTHSLRERGLESLLRLPPTLLPQFFEGFFTLATRRQEAYLSDRDHPLATLAAMTGLFATTPWPVRLCLIKGCA
ncbi:MAG: lycopene cyclase family protein [Pseudonocardia sp.]|nr:lycopene cyclase family protein [Pseudonocardia sp.]